MKIPPLQRLALMTAFRQIKAKAPCGVRYSAEWLLNCMLVRIASPKAYKLLNDLKMLPLPSMSRLTAVKGNCSGTCESVLVSMQDSLCEKAKAVAELKLAVEAKLSKKLQCISLPCVKHYEHDYQKPDVDDMVVYYLCGYVHKKVEKTISCRECHVSLTAASEDLALAPRPAESQLTEMRSFKEGCLHHPSHRLYCMVKEMETIVEHALDSSPIFGDLF